MEIVLLHLIRVSIILDFRTYLDVIDEQSRVESYISFLSKSLAVTAGVTVSCNVHLLYSSCSIIAFHCIYI